MWIKISAFVKSTLFLYSLVGVLSIGTLSLLYHKIYKSGYDFCKAEQLVEQDKLNKKVDGITNEIKRKAPARSDNTAVTKFLLERTVDSQ